MRTIELKGGSVDLRINLTRTEVCLIFGAPDADVRLFRTLSVLEARAIHRSLGATLATIDGGE